MPKDPVSVTVTKLSAATKSVTKKHRRGRPPLGRKAMTNAQRQARHRQRLKEAAKQRAEELLRGQRRPSQPPYGYNKAKAQLQAAGHRFETARRDLGFEEGTFVDGAFLGSHEVLALADMPPRERQQLLAEVRRTLKDDACGAVQGYMAALRVTLDELVRFLERTAPAALAAKRRTTRRDP
jgi:hypothetical protein